MVNGGVVGVAVVHGWDFLVGQRAHPHTQIMMHAILQANDLKKEATRFVEHAVIASANFLADVPLPEGQWEALPRTALGKRLANECMDVVVQVNRADGMCVPTGPIPLGQVLQVWSKACGRDLVKESLAWPADARVANALAKGSLFGDVTWVSRYRRSTAPSYCPSLSNRMWKELLRANSTFQGEGYYEEGATSLRPTRFGDHVKAYDVLHVVNALRVGCMTHNLGQVLSQTKASLRLAFGGQQGSGDGVDGLANHIQVPSRWTLQKAVKRLDVATMLLQRHVSGQHGANFSASGLRREPAGWRRDLLCSRTRGQYAGFAACFSTPAKRDYALLAFDDLGGRPNGSSGQGAGVDSSDLVRVRAKRGGGPPGQCLRAPMLD